MQPFLYLIKKEVYRFLSIWVQTVIGPVSVSILYQLIFGHQLARLSTGIPGINYSTYLIPGLIMMQVLSTSFANGSSSLIQAKYNGNIIFVLMAPITPFAMYSAYLVSSIIRGIIVGCSVMLAISYFGLSWPNCWWAVIYFLLLGSSVTAGLGLIAGILATKFDQLDGFNSFIIVPLIYLAGIFFNPYSLPGIWHIIALCDPFFYIIDGFRYGFLYHSASNIVFGAIFVLFCAIFINLIGFLLLLRGVKIKQ